MSVEAILTVVTVVLAVLALIPQARAQDLRLRLGGKVAWVGGGAAVVLVLYWAFLEQVHTLPVIRALPRPIPWVGNWTSASLSLLTLLFATGVAWRGYARRLPVVRVPRLRAVIADTLARRRYGECLHLLETHLATLHRALRGDYWQARVRQRVLPTAGEQFVHAHRRATAAPRVTQHALPVSATASGTSIGVTTDGAGTDDAATRLARLAALRTPRERGRLARWLSARAERPRDAAQDILRQLAIAPGLIRELAAVNPYLGIRLLHLESTWIYREFAETFARALLADPESILYRELRRAENVDSRGMIAVDGQDQPLVAALIADAARPDGPRLLPTFLEFGVDAVRWPRPSELTRVLNGPMADYRERGRWVSPPFATLYLLRIVAPRLALDATSPVLNLYVVRTLVTTVLEQMQPSNEGEAFGEWPTPSHYLLSEAVSVLRDLVRMFDPRTAAPGLPTDARADHAMQTKLADHAIDVLGSVMYVCLRSTQLDARFKSDLLESWWRAYSDKYQAGWSRSSDVLGALVRGGSPGSGDMAHRQGLADALEHVDHVIRTTPAAHELRARFGLGGA